MSILSEQEIRNKSVLDVASKMASAARTAPKAKGIDNLEIVICQGETIELIAAKMKEMVEEGKAPDFFVRDADNILNSQALFLAGTRYKPLGVLQCGLCGYYSCKEKSNEHPCVFNTGDLGIAIGSAASVAMDNRVDNRIMYSVGKAALELKLLSDDIKIIYGIPLSISGKNPFFDR